MSFILTINPGNTSTKVALFDDEKSMRMEVIRHSKKETEKYASITDQLDFRKNAVEEFLNRGKIDLESIDYYIGRGGYMKPVKSGLYEVNKEKYFSKLFFSSIMGTPDWSNLDHSLPKSSTTNLSIFFIFIH